MSKNTGYEHFVAGLSGGVISTLVLHPFDLIKIRFQVNDGKSAIQYRQTYRGIVDALRSIVRSTGVKGLYQGVSPNVVGAGSSWGLYFFAFNFGKEWMKERQNVNDLSTANLLLNGCLAGVFTLTIMNPVWVVKTRMCLQSEMNASQVYYSGVIDGLKKLYKHEGIRGYYRGYIPGLLSVSHGALQFMMYEKLKEKRGSSAQLNALEVITMSATSKVFAVVTTYPNQVIRSRLQDVQLQSHYNGFVDIAIKILRNEGITGFYKGLLPSLLRVTPACCITFLVYENVKQLLVAQN